MANADAVLQELSIGVTQIIKKAAGNYVANAELDANDFLGASKALVQQWLEELNDGKMKADEFQFLAEGRLKELVELKALTQAGVAAATLDATRSQIASLVIATIGKLA